MSVIPAASPLISTTDLAAALAGAPADRPIVLDVRWSLTGSDRAGYLSGHLPGAVFVDLDRELAGPAGEGGRHPLPEARDLQEVWQLVGIDADSAVVVYDGGSGLASARAWWLLRWSGLRTVRVLDGGFAAWIADPGRPTGSGAEKPARRGSVVVTPGAMPSVDVDGAAEAAASPSAVLVDARAAARFRGEIEPLDPVAGHIPGSVNLPIGDLLSPDGTFRPAAELAAALAAVGVRAGTSVAASCGSGVTACQLILAGEVAGLELALYPGSYSQWCALGRPVAVGG